MSNQRAAGADVNLVDVGSLSQEVRELLLRRRAGADATISGHFVDLNGRIISPDGGTTWTYTGTVNATARLLTTILGVAIPEAAAGFACKITVADIILCAINLSAYTAAGVFAVPATLETDMDTFPERYKCIVADTDAVVVLGRG